MSFTAVWNECVVSQYSLYSHRRILDFERWPRGTKVYTSSSCFKSKKRQFFLYPFKLCIIIIMLSLYCSYPSKVQFQKNSYMKHDKALSIACSSLSHSWQMTYLLISLVYQSHKNCIYQRMEVFHLQLIMMDDFPEENFLTKI